ncbi:glycosyltransferase involved in cell wall biosynthesis [Rhizobium sullae]|uniref:Glycosyltransferase involved in cell wall biosynthesis n=1 Tax=Rhizobium sullae TaxID=50338 RepID=A0A4R3Q8J1_RHISU|nr:glycosyltransferase involved in cell wall biosynthesis [Rhizobium sullae]
MPRVSICIPAYKPDFFELALKSAIAQSFADTEIIVSDDCPTDAIEKICERYSGVVHYSRNPNPAEYKNVIRLAGLANGEYIKYLFDDDVLNPFCIQYLLQALEATRGRGTRLAFSPRYFIDEKNQVTNLGNGLMVENSLTVIEGRDFIRITAVKHHNLLGEFSSVLLRTADCFDEAGRFSLFKVVDGIISGPLDLSSWVGLSLKGAIVGHPMPLSYFRQHSNSQSNPATNRYFIYSIIYYEEVLELAIANGFLQPPDLPIAYRNLINHYSYWRGSFPELDERIARISTLL